MRNNPESCIETRAADYPESVRATYRKAMTTKSKAAAIKAFCVMCMGYEDFVNGIRNCTAPACPLYPHRPYRIA